MEIVKNQAARRVNLTKLVRPITNSQKAELADVIIATFGEQYADKIRARLDKTNFFYMGSRKQYEEYVNVQVKEFFNDLIEHTPYFPYSAADNIYSEYVIYGYNHLALLIQKMYEIKDYNPNDPQDMLKILKVAADCPWVIGLPPDICRSPEWKKAVSKASESQNGSVEELFKNIENNFSFDVANKQMSALVIALGSYAHNEELPGTGLGETRQSKDLANLFEAVSFYLSTLRMLKGSFKMTKSQKDKYLQVLGALYGCESEKKILANKLLDEFIAKIEKIYNISFDQAKKEYKQCLWQWEKSRLADAMATVHSRFFGKELFLLRETISSIVDIIMLMLGEDKNSDSYRVKFKDVWGNVQEELYECNEQYNKLAAQIDEYWETKFHSGVASAVVNAMKGAGLQDKKYGDIFLRALNDGRIDFTKCFSSSYLINIASDIDVASYIMLEIGKTDDEVLFHESVHAISRSLVGRSKKHGSAILTSGFRHYVDRTDYVCPEPEKIIKADHWAAALKNSNTPSDSFKARYMKKHFDVPAEALGHKYLDEVTTEWLAKRITEKAKNMGKVFLKNQKPFSCLYDYAFPIMKPFLEKYTSRIIEARMSDEPLEFAREIGFENYVNLGRAVEAYLDAEDKCKPKAEIDNATIKLENIVNHIMEADNEHSVDGQPIV